MLRQRGVLRGSALILWDRCPDTDHLFIGEVGDLRIGEFFPIEAEILERHVSSELGFAAFARTEAQRHRCFESSANRPRIRSTAGAFSIHINRHRFVACKRAVEDDHHVVPCAGGQCGGGNQFVRGFVPGVDDMCARAAALQVEIPAPEAVRGIHFRDDRSGDMVDTFVIDPDKPAIADLITTREVSNVTQRDVRACYSDRLAQRAVNAFRRSEPLLRLAVHRSFDIPFAFREREMDRERRICFLRLHLSCRDEPVLEIRIRRLTPRRDATIDHFDRCIQACPFLPVCS